MMVADVRVSGRVDKDRLWHRLMALAQFGRTDKGGVCRLALSDEEIAARKELVGWARGIGLEPSNDAAGNLFLRLEGRDPARPPLLIGSHIDSQPTGGKFDGAYGVVAALEAVEAIIKSGRTPRRPIEVVAWMNEEGSRFAPGMMGSAVFTGARRLADIEAVEDRNGRRVDEALRVVLDAEAELRRRPLGFPVAGFLQAHIEQGVALERAGVPIGVVIGIQGKRTFRVTAEGQEGHAGTTRRADRRDALVSAIAIAGALQQAMWDEADTVRFTIGQLTVTPNAPSVVPGRVVFSIDLRHDDRDTIRRLGDRVPAICEAARGVCDVKVQELLYDPPLQFPPRLRELLADTSARLGFARRELQSPAGHDSRYLHLICPTAMIFIPCKDGVSHNEAESIEPSDAEAGARLLAEAAFAFAESESDPAWWGFARPA